MKHTKTSCSKYEKGIIRQGAKCTFFIKRGVRDTRQDFEQEKKNLHILFHNNEKGGGGVCNQILSSTNLGY